MKLREIASLFTSLDTNIWILVDEKNNGTFKSKVYGNEFEIFTGKAYEYYDYDVVFIDYGYDEDYIKSELRDDTYNIDSNLDSLLKKNIYLRIHIKKSK